MFANVLKFNPNHDEKGKFSSSNGGITGQSRNQLHGMFDRIAKPDGGFTYQPTTGEEPKEGYALSIYPDKSFAKPAGEFKFSDLVGYYLKNRDVFSQQDHYLGAWNDPSSHNVFLDVSVVKSSQQEAEKLALAHDQIAYFDLKSMSSVTVNPNAKSGVLKHGQTGIESGKAGRGFGAVFAGEAVQGLDRQGTDRAGAEGSSGVAEKSDLANQDLDTAGRVGDQYMDASQFRKPLFSIGDFARVFANSMFMGLAQKFNPNHDEKNGQFTSGAGGPSESADRSGAGSGEGISLRPHQADAISASVTHYGSSGGLSTLSAAYYGRGIKGAEAARLAKSNDSNIKNRVYFYLNPEQGLPRKEAGLGPHVYQQKLSNLYDFSKDPANIVPRMKQIEDSGQRANFMESEIVKAGYDGYTVKAYNMAVVLGKDVPVEYKGTDARKGFGQVLKFNPFHDPANGQFTTGSITSDQMHATMEALRNVDDHPNIMKLKVDGKMPFGGDNNLGIPRIDMPQIPRAERENFVQSLGVGVKTERIDPLQLIPTQDELDGYKVAKIYHKIQQGDVPKDPILVSRDHYIIDGHHHWGAYVAAKVGGVDSKATIPSYVVDMDHKELLDAARKYADAHGFQSKDITKAEQSIAGFGQVLKHNPYHDERGRFASHDGAHFISMWGKGYAQAANEKASTGTPKMTVEQAKEEYKKNFPEMNHLADKISDGDYFSNPGQILASPLTEDQKAFKSLFDKQVELLKVINPDHQDVEKALATGYPQLSYGTKSKMGLPLDTYEQKKLDGYQEQQKVEAKYNSIYAFQGAKGVQQTAMLMGKNHDELTAKMLEAKAQMKALGVTDEEAKEYEAEAKASAESNFKNLQTQAETALKDKLDLYHANARNGTMDSSNLDSLKQSVIGEGYLSKQRVDELETIAANKDKALSTLHQQLKAMVPEGQKLSKELDSRDFSKWDKYDANTTDFFKMEHQKYLDMPHDVQSTLVGYTSSGYKVNKAIGNAVTERMLGGPGKLNSSEKAYMARMDRATSETLDQDMLLKRNFPTKYMLAQMGYTADNVNRMSQAELDKAFVGKVYHDTSYGSASTNHNFSGTFSAASAAGEGTMTIRAPKGTHGIGVEHFSDNNGEYEVVLQRGTTYIIRSITKTEAPWGGLGRLLFNVDIIGQHPDKLD